MVSISGSSCMPLQDHMTRVGSISLPIFYSLQPLRIVSTWACRSTFRLRHQRRLRHRPRWHQDRRCIISFAVYGNSGPFTNNVTPPGINATFLNNVESFLDQIISSAVADANVTANGSGALTVVSATMTAAGTGLTVSHNALVSGVLTTTGNHVANGGMNIGTIRDNTTGAPQATLVTAGIT